MSIGYTIQSNSGGRGGRHADTYQRTLLASAAQTATGNSASQEFGDRRVARMTLDVTAEDTLTSLDVLLETSPTGLAGTWYTAGTYTQVTSAPANERIAVAIDRFVRISWTLVGTSVTFSVSGELV